jgi:hypothetical protein
VSILLVAIGGNLWQLVFILFMLIGAYFIGGYWCLLMVIILVVILLVNIGVY